MVIKKFGKVLSLIAFPLVLIGIFSAAFLFNDQLYIFFQSVESFKTQVKDAGWVAPFLFITLLFLLLDGFIRTGNRKLLYGIPLLMLLWSNTHAGALMGVATLGLFGIGYVLENHWTGVRFTALQNILMVAMVVLSCLIFVAAPSGLDTFRCIIFQQSGLVREIVSEYASPWSLWPATLYYWVFISVTLVSLPGFFDKSFLKQGVLVIALGLISTFG